MDDSFTFGTRARRSVTVKPVRRSRTPRRVAARDRSGTGRSGRGRIAVLVVGGVVVVVAIAGVMALMKRGGDQAAAGEHSAVSQIGTADDVQAKMTAQQTAGAVQQVYAEQGSYAAVTPAALRAVEPAAQYSGN